jgi:hypothetical protein
MGLLRWLDRCGRLSTKPSRPNSDLLGTAMIQEGRRKNSAQFEPLPSDGISSMDPRAVANQLKEDDVSANRSIAFCLDGLSQHWQQRSNRRPSCAPARVDEPYPPQPLSSIVPRAAYRRTRGGVMLTIETTNANLQKGFSEYARGRMDRPVA